MRFPTYRGRRVRANDTIRSLVRETELSISHIIYPLFVRYGKDIVEPIESMPGQFRYSCDTLIKEISELREMGICAILLFGIPENKDPFGRGAYDKDGIVQVATRMIKDRFPDMFVITDVCLCEYTDHGHCGVVKDGKVDNDLTLELLGKTALSQVRAGSDMVAPSDMMDGRVGYIRKILDEEGFSHIPIMSYAAKYASSFYGPFREAAESAPKFGDRKSYQMDPANVREAEREICLDIEEGADIIMIKPALSYLDVIRMAREKFSHPICAYSVSGEYSMIKAAAKMGWIDEDRIILEVMTSIRRAGADMIITYFAKKLANLLA